MNERDDPREWKAPEWHSDFGSSTVELEHLRALALELRERLPVESIRLETPEPGLMFLRLEFANSACAEAYSVPAGDESDLRRYAIYWMVASASEQELYANSLRDAITVFHSFLGSASA